MRIKHLYIITLLIFAGISLNAQIKEDSTYVKPTKTYIKYLDLRFENGAMMGNGNTIGDQLIESSYYNGMDVRLGFRKSDKDDVYSNVYRRPYLGVGWYASTFHNESIGNPNALYFFLTIPFAFEFDERLTFSYTAAFGLSYNFNAFDEETNPENIFLGSRNNCYVHLGFLANYNFSERWSANATIGFKHFSNGSSKLPNLGLNLLPFTLGVSYKMNKEPEMQLSPGTIAKYMQHDLINVAWYNGSKNYTQGEEQNYYKTGIGINYLRQINYKYRIGLGVDVFYSPYMEERGAEGNSVSTAIVGSWEWALTRRLYVPIGLAVYLNRNEANGEKAPYYERVGLRYRITDHLNAGVTIKAHGGAADFFEWTIGYSFYKDPNKY